LAAAELPSSIPTVIIIFFAEHGPAERVSQSGGKTAQPMKTTMKKADVAQYRKALQDKKAELEASEAKSLLFDESETDRQGDFADRSAAANEEEISIQLKQTDSKLLRAIDEALTRMEAGTYGVCVECQEEIAPARLKAVPWTKVCISCKEKQYR
jgi:DnaK suppressor protein